MRGHARSSQAGFSDVGHDRGRDRRPPGRQFGQRGRLEIAEHGHGDRARDRRRGHDEQVRRLRGLAAQGVALLDAEAVLLVDDDETELGELDVVLDQRVRADDDARLAARRLEQHAACGPPPVASRSAARRACRGRRRRAGRPAPAARASPRWCGRAAPRAPRSGRAAPPAPRRRRPGASPAARRPSCRNRPRPAAAGASGAAARVPRRASRRPRAGRR